MSDSKDPKMEKAGSEPVEKKGFMSKMAHGVGTLIKGSVEASDRMLNFAQDTKEKSAHGTLAGNRKKKKQKPNKRRLPVVRDLFKENSNFSEEQKKELAAILEKQLADMEKDEYAEVEEDDDEDDGYFGVTDPGLTAPTMTMGLRNSFGDFFGTAADAMEARGRDNERRNSIYR